MTSPVLSEEARRHLAAGDTALAERPRPAAGRLPFLEFGTADSLVAHEAYPQFENSVGAKIGIEIAMALSALRENSAETARLHLARADAMTDLLTEIHRSRAVNFRLRIVPAFVREPFDPASGT